jgi:succinate dehydrogenase flavin-adding protein (antitoxin of CptAB toxin-antitoxin module)
MDWQQWKMRVAATRKLHWRTARLLGPRELETVEELRHLLSQPDKKLHAWSTVARSSAVVEAAKQLMTSFARSGLHAM